MTAPPWLEDFNDPPPQAALPPPDPEPEPPPEPVPDPRLEGWHEGFVAGHRQAMLSRAQDRPAQAAVLAQHIAALEGRLEAIAARSAAQMAELLVDMLAEAAPPDWPDTARERLAEVIEAVKPSFWLDPKFHLHLPEPARLDLRDLPALAHALDTLEATDWPVTLHWQAGTVTAEALRDVLT